MKINNIYKLKHPFIYYHLCLHLVSIGAGRGGGGSLPLLVFLGSGRRAGIGGASSSTTAVVASAIATVPGTVEVNSRCHFYKWPGFPQV